MRHKSIGITQMLLCYSVLQWNFTVLQWNLALYLRKSHHLSLKWGYLQRGKAALPARLFLAEEAKGNIANQNGLREWVGGPKVSTWVRVPSGHQVSCMPEKLRALHGHEFNTNWTSGNYLLPQKLQTGLLVLHRTPAPQVIPCTPLFFLSL